MSTRKAPSAKVQIAKDGPYMSSLVADEKADHRHHSAAESVKWIEGQTYPEQAAYALCRCGHSAKKPYCDGSHARVRFDGAETASREPIESRPRSCKVLPCR